MANGNRGQVKQMVLTVEYPDGSTKTVRVDPSKISKLVFQPQSNDALPEGWETSDWKTNPTFIVHGVDGSVYGSCATSQHPPGDGGP